MAPSFGKAPGGPMEYLKQVRDLTRVFPGVFSYNEKVSVHNYVIKLHSTVTVIILFVGTMFVTMRQYFGEPIECLSRQSDVPASMLQHYCWLEATFSVSDPTQGAALAVGTDIAYPGVKPYEPHRGDKKIYHKYYQWVYFVLIIQTALFYIPKYLWKSKEKGRLQRIITDLRHRHLGELSAYDRTRLLQDVADSLYIGKDYFVAFSLIEAFCLVHIILQIWFTDIFLGRAFFTFGYRWLKYTHLDQDERQDPLIRVFPRMTKCTFHKYGFSGTIERYDALCFLPLNIVNEKLYVVIWFWFFALLIVTLLGFLDRLIVAFSSSWRYRRLRWLAPTADKKYIRLLCRRVGVWFVLDLIAQNIKPFFFRDLIEDLMKESFDSEGRPFFRSKSNRAIPESVGSIQPTLIPTSKNNRKVNNGAKGSGKGRTKYHPAPQAGFVIADSEPGLSQQEDWNEDYIRNPSLINIENDFNKA